MGVLKHQARQPLALFKGLFQSVLILRVFLLCVSVLPNPERVNTVLCLSVRTCIQPETGAVLIFGNDYDQNRNLGLRVDDMI